MRRFASYLAAAACACAPIGAHAAAAVSISVTPTALSFTSSGIANHYLTASATIGITGQITTNLGTASLALLSPANITGTGGGVLKISYFSMTCSGPAQAGQTFTASKTPLVASSSVNCATYARGFDSNNGNGNGTGLNVTLSLFLDERTLSADSYPATNFTIIASAT